MLAMTRPTSKSKVLLLADPRAVEPGPGGIQVKRYRLARLQFESRSAQPDMRYEHLKRSHD